MYTNLHRTSFTLHPVNLECTQMSSLKFSSIRYGLVVRIPGSHPGGPGSIPGNGTFCFLNKWAVLILPGSTKSITTKMGFEPTRAEPIGLAVQRLNHSATSSSQVCWLAQQCVTEIV